ncbi:MAG TPA: type II toxin-antitoxin system VapC family toxin [Longimicrobium sp.]|nr:type II toxin-antitoxin system VapC family toxin [Longimicrobium sp.]
MLLDSNIVIYAAEAEHEELRDFIDRHSPAVSIITHVEVLGFWRIGEEKRVVYEEFFAVAEKLPLSHRVAEQAIHLRQQRRIGLGDSIVAATALVHGEPLATRNTRDFRWIPGLTLVNPVDADWRG